MVKRGGGIGELGLGGPQLRNLLNFSEKLSEDLDARNAWAHCCNELNPNAPAVLRIPRIDWFTFKRIKREFVLAHDGEGWVLCTLPGWRASKVIGALALVVGESVLRARREAAEKERKAKEADAKSDDDTKGGPQSGASGTGNPKRKPTGSGEAGSPADQPPARDRGEPDEFRPISTAPRRARAARSPQPGRATLMWTMRKIARRAPCFRHMRFLLQDAATLANAAARQLAGQAQNALSRSLQKLNDLFADAEQIVQQQCNETLPEPRVVERNGRRLIVWTFSTDPRTPWECWLFGQLIEERQVMV